MKRILKEKASLLGIVIPTVIATHFVMAYICKADPFTENVTQSLKVIAVTTGVIVFTTIKECLELRNRK